MCREALHFKNYGLRCSAFSFFIILPLGPFGQWCSHDRQIDCRNHGFNLRDYVCFRTPEFKAKGVFMYLFLCHAVPDGRNHGGTGVLYERFADCNKDFATKRVSGCDLFYNRSNIICITIVLAALFWNPIIS